MADDVAALVLQDNYEQTETLSLAEANAASMVDVHQRFLRFLESRRNLNRELEALPGRRGDRRAQARARRPHPAGARGAARLQQDRPERGAARLGRARGPVPVGRARPLLPVAAARALRRAHALAPARPPDRCDPGGQQHAARRRHHVRVQAARGDRRARLPDRARLRRAPARSSRCAPLWAEIEALDNRCGAEVQIDLLLEGRRLVERASRWLLGNRPRAARHRLDRVGTSAPARWGCTRRSRGCCRPRTPSRSRAAPTSCASSGVPEDLATRVSALPIMFSALDIVTVADETELDVERVGAVHFRLGQPPGAPLAARPDRGAAARQPLAGAGAGGAARRHLRDPPRDHRPRCCARARRTPTRSIVDAGSSRTRRRARRSRRSATSAAARATT